MVPNYTHIVMKGKKMRASQTSHSQSFIDNLNQHILEIATDENLSYHDASLRGVLDWLGYEIEDASYIENADRGIDAWIATEGINRGLDIFQVKTHDLTDNGNLELSNFDDHGINDLRRAKDFLVYETISNVRSKKLKELLSTWNSILIEHKQRESENPLRVTLNLVVLGNGLTEQGNLEFETFKASLQNPEALEIGVQVQFHTVLYTIDDIVDIRWREANREWKDRKGDKKESIYLTPLDDQFISDNKNAVFYCSAIDLVNAFSSLGYQLFEPNVRAEIKKSRVNQAIRESVIFAQTRRDFRFLNNGVTLTCSSYRKPNLPQKNSFTAKHPGVVNGLQTVMALHNAYTELTTEEKESFEEECWVLVRLLTTNAVPDITQVVRATNNQNPMQPRNLVSNNIEQVLYFRTFAENLGWFYEAKQGAWDAFCEDYKRWQPRINMRPKDFRPNEKRRKARRIDNHELAQKWLSFIGFSRVAVNEKKRLFEERQYKLIFKQRTGKHGFDYNYDWRRASDNARNLSPASDLLLVAHLAFEFARFMTPSPQENRRQAMKRLRIAENISRQEQDVLLSKDEKFVLMQALNAMAYLFVEFTGFIFFKTFEEELHRMGPKILANHTYQEMTKHTVPNLDQEQIWNGDFSPDDVLVVLWLIFVDTIEDLFNSPWGEGYKTAIVKTRFILRAENRTYFYKTILKRDSYMQKKTPQTNWSFGVKENQGLFDFIKQCILNNNSTNK